MSEDFSAFIRTLKERNDIVDAYNKRSDENA